MIKKTKLDIKTYETDREKELRRSFLEIFRASPVPDDQTLSNLGLFLSSKNLSRILFLNYIYQMIIDVQGVIVEFGTRWGQNLALFSALRGIYEPFNRHRKITGFDTFKGFSSISVKDGKSDMMFKGNLALTNNYFSYLEKVLDYHDLDSPLSHIKKYELVAGDAAVEIKKYLKKFPETIISLAFFDFDLYKPTKVCLEAIRPHLVKGSVLAFDELNDHDSPGETLALSEVFGLNNIKLKRFRNASRTAYFVFE